MDLVLIRGNHDNFLRNILNRKGMELQKEFRVGEFRIVHGHETFDMEGITIIGHEHPSLKLRDTVGASVSISCFLALPNLVVLPAFSPLAYGTDIFQRPYISPVLNTLDMSEARVVGVDDDVGLLDFQRMGDIRREGWERHHPWIGQVSSPLGWLNRSRTAATLPLVAHTCP